MLPEARNLKSQYPFVYKASASVAQKAFMQSIRYLSLWLYTQESVTASVVQFAPSYFDIKIQGTQIETVIRVAGNSFSILSENPQHKLKLDFSNSFVLYTSPISVTGTCNLELLPQVLILVPRGLQLKINTNKVKSKAQNGVIQSPIQWSDSSINFIPGYNFEGQAQNNALILTAGAGLGLGSPSAYIVRSTISDSDSTIYENTESDSAYIGLRSINGQSGQLQFDTSTGLYFKTDITQQAEKVIATLKLYRRGN